MLRPEFVDITDRIPTLALRQKRSSSHFKPPPLALFLLVPIMATRTLEARLEQLSVSDEGEATNGAGNYKPKAG